MSSKNRTKKTSKNKKINISRRRKMSLLYKRFVLTIRILVLIGLIGLGGVYYFHFNKSALLDYRNQKLAVLGFKLETLVIQGLNNMPESRVINNLGLYKDMPIFAIDLEVIKTKLEQDPWIDKVIATRQLPSTIKIYIHERRPLAIWQVNKKCYVIDKYGRKLMPLILQNGHIIDEQQKKFGKLLYVVGSRANLFAYKLDIDLTRYPTIRNKVQVATLQAPGRWDLYLDNNMLIKMPKDEFYKAMDYLVDLEQKHQLNTMSNKLLDLRNFPQAVIKDNFK